MQRIDIGRHFTRLPGGRYRAGGEGSGEEFREAFLLPALKAGRDVEVKLDNAYGYLGSFLEEAFGGLIRAGVPLETLQQRLKIVARDPVNAVHVTGAWRAIHSAHETKSQEAE